MAEDLTRPYVGYRSAGRRPERQQDRRAAADAPLAALRGLVSGVLGAPGDVESLVRMLPGLSEQTVLPTSEDVERRLPLRGVSETPAGRAFTTAGQLGGGFYTGPGSPLRAVAAVPSAVRRAARDFAVAAGQPAVNVVKPKGGNWLAGSIERAIEPIKARDRFGMTDPRDTAAALGIPLEEAQALTAANAPNVALNRWLEGKLTKYIRNEMATPEDPLRALAERGVTHIPEGVEGLERSGSWVPENLGPRRKAAGFPEEGLATTPAGQGWELIADEAIHNMPARMRVSPDTGGGSTKALQVEQENPWLLKVPPETMTYGAYPVEVRQELGFEHLVDELRNAINPESGLPRELLWKYSDLDKVTVPQAVERVAKINEWRAAQKAEADLARAQNAATQVFKEYPEQGFRWVELKAPSEFSNPSQKEEFGDLGRYARSTLSDALKYEGETMGHCVGGYCEDVASGRSKIFSLRDKKGQPHVTIETRPGNITPLDFPKEIYGEYRKHMAEGISAHGGRPGAAEWLKHFHPEIYEQIKPPDEIVQIKGKANRAPNPEYLPAVQDFVRSGKWSKIGDLQNTGLRSTSDVFNETEQAFLRSKGVELKPYIDPDEAARYQELFKRKPDSEPGFAAGGLVGLHQRYAAGGEVEDSAGEAETAPLDTYKFANRQLAGGNDVSAVGLGAGAELGGGRLDAALEMMRMQRAQDSAPQDAYSRAARLSYNRQLGDVGLNATAIKPLDVEGVYLGMLNGSIPLGLGRLLLGLQAEKTPWHTGVTGHSVGYAGRVGPGTLGVNLMRSRSGDTRGQVEYRVPFAAGGAVAQPAQIAVIPYDEAKIDALASMVTA